MWCSDYFIFLVSPHHCCGRDYRIPQTIRAKAGVRTLTATSHLMNSINSVHAFRFSTTNHQALIWLIGMKRELIIHTSTIYSLICNGSKNFQWRKKKPTQRMAGSDNIPGWVLRNCSSALAYHCLKTAKQPASKTSSALHWHQYWWSAWRIIMSFIQTFVPDTLDSLQFTYTVRRTEQQRTLSNLLIIQWSLDNRRWCMMSHKQN